MKESNGGPKRSRRAGPARAAEPALVGLSFFLRGLKEPVAWTASAEEAQRLGPVLRDQVDYEVADRFFCFKDAGGRYACINTDYIQFARVLAAEGAAAPAPPEAVIVRLDGVEELQKITAAHPEELDLRFELEEAGSDDFLGWYQADGREVYLRTGDIVWLEYPEDWGSQDDEDA